MARPGDAPEIREVHAPSAAHPTPREALEAILAAYMALADPGQAGWVSVVARGEGGPSLQYVDGAVNLLHHALPLDELLRDAGCEDLEGAVKPFPLRGRGRGRREDQTLWRVASPTPGRVARILHVALSRGHALGDDYAVEAVFESSGTAPPGPLETPLARVGLAGWPLLALALVAVVGVSAWLGPRAYEWAREHGWQKLLPVGTVLLVLPGLAAGTVVYLLGRRLLARCGIATERERSARDP